MDDQGGYAVIQTANQAGLTKAPRKFARSLAYEVTPVVDLAEGVGFHSAGVAFRESV